MSKFLVVVPAYNAAPYLRQTVCSVQRQTLTDWRMVIVDDGSTDATPALADELAAEDARISVVHQANRGLTPTRNAGWRGAPEPAEYLYFLDADDVAYPGTLARAAGYLDAHPAVGCVYGVPRHWHPADPSQDFTNAMERYRLTRLVGVGRIASDVPFTPISTLLGFPVVIPSVCFFRASVFEEIGGWDEQLLDGAEDIDQSVQCALRSEVHFLDEPMVQYRRHERAMNNDHARYIRGRLQMRRKWEEYARSDAPHALTIGRALDFTSLMDAYGSSARIAPALRQRQWVEAAKNALRTLRNGSRFLRRKYSRASPAPRQRPERETAAQVPSSRQLP